MEARLSDKAKSGKTLLFKSCVLFLAIAFLLGSAGVVSAGQISREEFEFVIEGELPVEEEPPEENVDGDNDKLVDKEYQRPPDVPPSTPPPEPEPELEPAPEPDSSVDTSPDSTPTPQPIFTYTPQPFVRNYNFDDRRSDVPLNSPAGQFLMGNVYGGSPNSAALRTSISPIMRPTTTPQRLSTPSSTFNSTKSALTVTSIVKTIVNMLFLKLF